VAQAGWIKLHRCLMDKPIWACSTIEQRVILITILLLANHADKQWEWKGKKFICKPGQFITSSTNLAKTAGVSRQNIRTSLKRFQDYDFLTYESTKTGTLVTIVNWDLYQSKTNELTNELTSSQPTPNQRLTTNKNDKKIKNDKKLYGDFVLLTDIEYEKLCKKYGQEITDKKIERMNNWLPQSKNKSKVTDHYRGLLNWLADEQEKNNSKSDKTDYMGIPL
jgi:DNA replication protein DnaD